ncbi:MAG TPA: TetR/AcrR family transcriptional regulator [Bacillus sp. (in: firmicutes)]|uniref:TetR/AcrR family transcriptional regulator n=1 Tax=Bacillus litorisediminis TaxID=2922713 RepID=UPI001FB04492|nr:TetR/AcrR family transcriptional regulator [Bacillus litorisediminis]HWO74458.1 TetR/AcrR family transcriptional regulator [Bacillus sp. (in: firmicutes)]
MRKGEKTKQQIIMLATDVFNQKGYIGTSLTDIMNATGLKKGGIYNHFENKEELAIASFDYAIEVMTHTYAKAIEGKKSAIDQLIALISIYENIIDNPPIKGGCPILNTAVESDDTNPVLRERAQEAMQKWLKLIQFTIRKGIRKNEIQPTVEIESFSAFLTSTIEGAVMLSKLYQTNSYMKQAIKHLTESIENLRVH